jgi:hypothetical protein
MASAPKIYMFPYIGVKIGVKMKFLKIKGKEE